MMVKNKDCNICGKELFSEIGKGCKMCGMPLENRNKEFCCEDCRKKYKEINHSNNKVIGKNEIIVSFVLLFLVFSISGFASAHSDEDFEIAQNIINSNISCTKLNDSQLEMIGDYYMEQIHPGEEHEYMDNMMGGEGSAALENMHISLAYRYYCDDNEIPETVNNYGMMGSRYPMMGYYQGQQQYSYLVPALIILVIVLTIALLLVVLKLNKKHKRK